MTDAIEEPDQQGRCVHCGGPVPESGPHCPDCGEVFCSQECMKEHSGACTESEA